MEVRNTIKTLQCPRQLSTESCGTPHVSSARPGKSCLLPLISNLHGNALAGNNGLHVSPFNLLSEKVSFKIIFQAKYGGTHLQSSTEAGGSEEFLGQPGLRMIQCWLLELEWQQWSGVVQLLPNVCNRRPWLSLLEWGGEITATNLELGRDKMIMSLRNSELHSKTLSQAAKRVGKLLR